MTRSFLKVKIGLPFYVLSRRLFEKTEKKAINIIFYLLRQRPCMSFPGMEIRRTKVAIALSLVTTIFVRYVVRYDFAH